MLHHAPGRSQPSVSHIVESAAALVLAGTVLGIISALGYAFVDKLPSVLSGLQYGTAVVINAVTKSRPVPLGFEQPWDQHPFNSRRTYENLRWLAKFFGNGRAGCQMSEALGNVAPDWDQAERHFADISKNPACPNQTRALFGKANIQFLRCISRRGVSECRQAVESYGIVMSKLKGQPNDQTLFWKAVIIRSDILWEVPETRLSPDDLDNAAVDLEDVLTNLAKTGGQGQLEQFGGRVKSGLDKVKATALQNVLAPPNEKSADPQQPPPENTGTIPAPEKAPISTDKKSNDLRHTTVRRHKKRAKPDARSSWHPCHLAVNSKGEMFPADKCR
jgi:hypothetical protein